MSKNQQTSGNRDLRHDFAAQSSPYFEKVLEVEEERWAIEQKNNRLGLQILALLDLSQAYIKVGQLEKAIKHAYHAISLNQGQYPGLDFLAYGQLAEYYHDLNKSVMAIIHYKQAIFRRPWSVSSYCWRGSTQ